MPSSNDTISLFSVPSIEIPNLEIPSISKYSSIFLDHQKKFEIISDPQNYRQPQHQRERPHSLLNAFTKHPQLYLNDNWITARNNVPVYNSNCEHYVIDYDSDDDSDDDDVGQQEIDEDVDMESLYKESDNEDKDMNKLQFSYQLTISETNNHQQEPEKKFTSNENNFFDYDSGYEAGDEILSTTSINQPPTTRNPTITRKKLFFFDDDEEEKKEKNSIKSFPDSIKTVQGPNYRKNVLIFSSQFDDYNDSSPLFPKIEPSETITTKKKFFNRKSWGLFQKLSNHNDNNKNVESKSNSLKKTSSNIFKFNSSSTIDDDQNDIRNKSVFNESRFVENPKQTKFNYFRFLNNHLFSFH